jgi:hypothetical protein
MDNRLVSEKDLHDVTGLKRKNMQVGRIILTWSAFEGLQAKRAGVLPTGGTSQRPALVPVRKAA